MSAPNRTGAVLFVKELKKVADFYENVAQLHRKHTAQDHVVLESGDYELVVHALPDEIAASVFIESPVVVREDCALKLVFFIDSISAAREMSARLGGLMHGSDREWQFNGALVCDGCDPEGNVVQFREQQEQ
jgi:predicted enzyme related to lactoylglutathione lyase